MTDSTSANFPPLVSRERSANTIRSALRLFIGRGRQFSVKQVSNATGVKDRVIESAMCDFDNADWRPLSIEALLSLSAFLGPVFTNEWLTLSDQGAFHLPDFEPKPGDLAADNSDDNATLTRAAKDGAFDDAECAELGEAGCRMIERGTMLVSLASHRGTKAA